MHAHLFGKPLIPVIRKGAETLSSNTGYKPLILTASSPGITVHVTFVSTCDNVPSFHPSYAGTPSRSIAADTLIICVTCLSSVIGLRGHPPAIPSGAPPYTATTTYPGSHSGSLIDITMQAPTQKQAHRNLHIQ